MQTGGVRYGAPVQRGKDFRPRGRRSKGRKGKVSCFLTMNTSGKPQLIENLDMLQARGTRTTAIFDQEHQQWRGGIADLQSALWNLGWQCRAVGAVAGPNGGASAGTAVIADRRVGFDRIFGTWDHGTGDAAGRVAAAWVQDVTRAGVLIVSTYLWHSEGLTERNIRVLGAVASIIDRHGGPWIVGGDALPAFSSQERAKIGWGGSTGR